MDKILVKTNYNWADEADFPSICVVDKKEYGKFKEDVRKTDNFYLEIYVGTNEFIELSSFDDIFDGVEEIELTPDELSFFHRIFDNDDEFGECTMIDIMETFYDEVLNE